MSPSTVHRKLEEASRERLCHIAEALHELLVKRGVDRETAESEPLLLVHNAAENAGLVLAAC